MEPNKLEQEFKQKLDERTIQPTGMAWDRLDAMLSVTEQKAPKKSINRNWMYMAACFLALLLAGTFFLNQQKNTTEINTNGNSAVTNNGAPIANPDNAGTVPTVTTLPAPQQQAAVTVSTSIKQFKQQVKATQTPPVEIINQPVPQQQEQVTQTTAPPQVTQPALKIQTIKVDATKLLASVEAKGKRQSAVATTITNPQVKVNTKALLSSVEGELDDSFRGKVLNTISKNYTTVKTAVANRNFQ